MIYQGDKLHGFEVTRVRRSDELNGTLYEMTHLATGARVCWLDNGLSNKLFAIGFTSLPCDDTGVFHILEHSVLCGSEKYPVKEPFVELKKNSLHTFLNAMTAPDKTIYPIASRNEQDYLNLMSVYLDAVFAPRLLTEENIFLQEGWHIEEKDGVLSCKGVVYNEMKGALSDEVGLMNRKFASLLFPDTSYRHNSGGTPAAIRRLTYRQFVESYRNTYHPSNAFVYLDGSVPLNKTLALLEEYFSRFERRTELPVFEMQTPVSTQAIQPFELKAGESPENKSSLCFGKIIGTWHDRLRVQAAGILADALAGSNEAPLRKALIDSGLAVNLSINIRADGLQPYIVIYIKHVRDGQEEAVLNLLRGKVRELLKTGIDRELLSALINRLEFSCREITEPQALYRMFAMGAFPFGADPLELLSWNHVLAGLREMLHTHEYETLLEEIFLSEEAMVTLKMTPSATLGEELRAEEEADLRTIWNGWSEAERAENRIRNEALLRWQQTPDSPENLAKIPQLPLSAVSDAPEWVETAEQETDGAKVLFHAIPSGNIVYASAYFDLTGFDISDMPALSIITKLLGKLPTRRRSAEELDRLMQNYTGKTAFMVLPFSDHRQSGVCRPMLTVRFSALKENFDQACGLISEILRETCFADAEKIRVIIRQCEILLQRQSVLSGQSLGILYTISRYTACGAVSEAVGGLTFHRRVQEFLSDFDTHLPALRETARTLQTDFLTRRRMTLSLSASVLLCAHPFLSAFPEGCRAPEPRAYSLPLPLRAGIQVPARVSYAVQGYHLSQSGLTCSGSMKVGAKLLSLDYLWNKVRVQGGAYGARFHLTADGDMYSYSYRDPSPHATLDVNLHAADYIRNLCRQGISLDSYILAASAEDDPLLSPRQAGERADSLYFAGLTLEDARRSRREILSAATDDLLAFCDLLEDFARRGSVCVIGHQDALKKCDSLEPLAL